MATELDQWSDIDPTTVRLLLKEGLTPAQVADQLGIGMSDVLIVEPGAAGTTLPQPPEHENTPTTERRRNMIERARVMLHSGWPDEYIRQQTGISAVRLNRLKGET